MVYLASDNTAGAHPDVLAMIQHANDGSAKAYGHDDWSRQLTEKFCRLFDTDLVVYPVFNGSAANSLALAALIKPYEAVISHQHSHIQQDECGMPEFFTGAKTFGVAGEQGKLSPDSIKSLVELASGSGVHHSRPKAVSLTQSTEAGTVYTVEEVQALADVAKALDLHVHMDGARIANAIVSLGCQPADMTWKAGVDVLSFGGTKNGALIAEAVIFFKPALVQDFGYIQKRAGQLASKQRFIAAQLMGLLHNRLWLQNAAHANAMAHYLANGLSGLPGVSIAFPVEANALFVRMPIGLSEALQQGGHYFYQWPLLGPAMYRLVTSFQTQPHELDRFIADCRSFCLP